ncbi:UNVERIFIED_CONTAM: hypothetical protein Sradi_3179500 [Sesamum radiatum]|uniref:Reverse transcriptase/retrotransposon-derived protein RNase H-like domain-containing protein n=1 Tax=Sesamum radiatum TaxID=300843 RepID=A0AAW2REX1_SESRA
MWKPSRMLQHSKKFGMKLNPSKCTFKAHRGKFLVLTVSPREIEANPKKIEAIIKMHSFKSVKEVQKLIGNIATLKGFISRSSDKGFPFFKVLKKIEGFSWMEHFQASFEHLKKYIALPPLLTKLRPGETQLLYLVVSKGGAVLKREEGPECQPIYYVSKSIQEPEERYPQIEKLALALVAAARRLRPYFQSNPMVVLTNHPLEKVLANPNI